MKRDVKLFIQDILEYVESIENSTKDTTKAKFDKNNLLQDATMRRLEIIGEASKNIPSNIKENHSEVPWKKIAGMRDILTHSYFKINSDRAWEVIKEDLPNLKKQIKRILEEIKLEELKKEKSSKT